MHRRCFAAGLVVLAAAIDAQQAPPDYGFDFVTIGDVGNRPYDREVLVPLNRPNVGVVDYEYRISRNEVGTAEYLEFLNTFTTQSDELDDTVGRPGFWGGEVDPTYSGPGTRYRLRGNLPDADRIPIRITWEDAARYINWLNNDKSSDPSAIENGAYDTSTFSRNPDNSANHPDTHDPSARYWLPTRDEWTKAAHWDPDKDGPGQGGWWIYSHGSDEPPVTGLPDTPGAETSAIDFSDPPSFDLADQLLDVPLGAYPDTQSPWGLLDITGGSREWLGDWADISFRSQKHFDGSSAGGSILPDLFEITDGSFPESRLNSFRIASIVPSPGVGAVLVLGSVLTLSTRSVRKGNFHDCRSISLLLLLASAGAAGGQQNIEGRRSCGCTKSVCNRPRTVVG